MSTETKRVYKGEDTSGVHIWLLLWKAYDAISRRAQANIGELGLSLSDFAVLEVLLHKGPLPVNTLGPKVGLTSGSISVAVDRLTARGLVVRRSSPGDRRERIVHLTDPGRELIECAFARHAGDMDSIATGLTDDERADLVRMLKIVGKSSV